MTQERLYRRVKLDLIQSKTIEQLEVAYNYMQLSKSLLNFVQWNDCLRNYENKKTLLTENIEI